ncbi:LysR family transcriptional regulator [Actinoallomurus soli]|uniref:LysR family transcriptional regulator n=1 Tax=Actinoallomurus soli TaxID=2952535 RepID=UPI0020937D25|nr:LysR family transcriptional regulator [Actinoallomurus soli]MCO5973047.1 LysR family transcriptional regulator [Actinoallomurus soli]
MDSPSLAPDNRISLHKLEVFCRVVERGGVRFAAEDLFVSQPVISAHLRSLEERLGVKLFRREGRGLELTEAGAEVHLWATEVLRGRTELDHSLRDIARGAAGRALIGSSMSVGNYVLPPILVDFRRRHPHASIALHQSNVEIALERTLAGRYDFSVLATDAVLDTNAFEAELIARPPFCLVAAIDDDRVGDSASAAELTGLPFVCPPAGMAIRRSQDSALAAIGVVDRRVEIELGSAESMKVAVQGGLGVALLWRESVRRELQEGLLREVRITGHDLRDKLYLVQRRGKRLTAFQSTLTSVLRDGIRARLDRIDSHMAQSSGENSS